MKNFFLNFNSKSVKTVIMLVLVSAIYFFAVNAYMLNKGFSIWDEGYYLLSYRMAFDGFYPHFNNTPFVVARLFEWMSPGLIGYRLIHAALNIFGGIFFTSALICYLRSVDLKCSVAEKVLLYVLTIYAAAYSYQISVATLSYNHLNEFFVLLSQGCLIFAVLRKSIDRATVLLVLVSGVMASFCAFIKPPTFLILIFLNVFFVIIIFYRKSVSFKYVSIFLTGIFGAVFVSFLWIMRPSEWVSYLDFMRGHTTHSPYDVLVSFFGTAFDMLRVGSGVIFASVALILVANNRSKFAGASKVINRFCVALIIGAFAICVLYVTELLLPQEIWNSFNIHWWFLWVYSSTFLLVVTVVFAVGVVAFLGHFTAENKLKLVLILFVLAANPIAMSIGTVNGFGQVQMHLTSWVLLIGVAFLVFLRHAPIEIIIYSFILIVLNVLVSVTYFTRQISVGNFSGQGAINEHAYRLNNEGPLRGILVDRPTHDLLADINAIISRYPKAPTLVFFDAPGLQYAFGRPWVVADPWLTNYDQPRTRDDTYNCRAITKDPEKLKQTIFIVARAKEISAELKRCLAEVGYPEKLNFLGSVNTTVGSMTEPINIYWHP